MWIWSYLLKESFVENFIFCAVSGIFHANVNQISSSQTPGCSAFFICYLNATRSTFGQYQGGSLTNLMLITTFCQLLNRKSPGPS